MDSETIEDTPIRELPPEPAAITKPRQSSELVAGGVTINGASYMLADIPAEHHAHLTLVGLRCLLLQGADADATMKRLRTGDIPSKKAAKARPLDHWREAGAVVQAERWAKERNIKSAPGRRLHDSPEFQALLPAARDVSRAWGKKELAIAQKTQRVVEVWTGLANPDTSGLFVPAVEQAA